MKHLVARSYFRIITDDATGSSRSVSLRRTGKWTLQDAKSGRSYFKGLPRMMLRDVAKR